MNPELNIVLQIIVGVMLLVAVIVAIWGIKRIIAMDAELNDICEHDDTDLDFECQKEYAASKGTE